MRNLETSIAQWRKSMMAGSKISEETLDELESHLRETVDQLVRSGLTEDSAFQRAITQLGPMPGLASEFQKLEASTWWPIRIATGIGILAMVTGVILLMAQLGAPGMKLLLAGHVFAVTLGYGTTFLIGALGICFVAQRCLSDFSPFRMHSLTRVTFVFGCIAAGLTVVGVILGMVWAKIEWGRYWAWDKKEIGACAVLVWQLCFLFAHRLSHVTIRGVLVMSLLGNIVVSLGWFGANLLHDGLHRYGMWNYALLLLVAVVSNSAFFFIGLAPAGWLRSRKA